MERAGSATVRHDGARGNGEGGGERVGRGEGGGRRVYIHRRQADGILLIVEQRCRAVDLVAALQRPEPHHCLHCRRTHQRLGIAEPRDNVLRMMGAARPPLCGVCCNRYSAQQSHES